MQLRTARLCLDCEEIHQEQQCPVCASEMFVYLTRWVPVEERRSRRRPAPQVRQEKSVTARWAQRGAIGLAAIAVSRLMWRSTQRPEQAGPPVPRRRAEDADSEVRSQLRALNPDPAPDKPSE